ncbi:MAG: ADP-glyceromanno-heptose 6-epimerase [Ignavibacteriales bacterium]|nr:MAG: ADP-glyceromanno-heptose 6-epimerase [Ignavibacteriales bacterium]
MIVVTGGAGFIGSAIVWRLNQLGKDDILIVDELGEDEKWKNLVGLNFADYLDKGNFIDRIIDGDPDLDIEAIIHMGACSSTTEKDADYLMHNNFKYTQELAKYCIGNNVRFIYASSAATYGNGEQGYDDNEKELNTLRPMNMYGYSKQLFDLWAKKNNLLNKLVGLKFFNVYGPNEFHKADMRSVVHKAYGQIKETGKVNLFKSYKKDYEDGEQMRDFIYVKDAVDMTLFFLENKDKNGIFNIGTGNARTWNDLVTILFKSLNKQVNVEYIEMPESIRDKYQYFTQANLHKLFEAGYDQPITSLEDGINDYVKNYLIQEKYLGT